MNIVGIVAEYNPFHNGHAYQIQYIKENLNADFIIAVMSGDYVQRGTPALLPKHARAQMALENGIDLVLELPVRFSTASAESFAFGAVEILHKLGCVSQICFGSECGEIAPFQKAAEILCNEPKTYRMRLSDLLKQGKSFPEARSKALSEYLSDDSMADFLSMPNNILGIEYCKALYRLNSDIQPVTLKRAGRDFHDKELSEGSLPSASGIRAAFSKVAHTTVSNPETSDTNISKKNSLLQETTNNLEKLLLTQMPANSVPSIIEAVHTNCFLTEADFDLILHTRLLTAVYENSLTDFLDVSPALAQRIANTLPTYKDFVSYTELLKTREVTYTRVQRALLHTLLGLKKESVSKQTFSKQESETQIPCTDTSCTYARVLGFQKASSALLKKIKENSQIPLLTKLSVSDQLLEPSAKALLNETIYASHLYEIVLTHKAGTTFRHEYQKPIIIK